MRNPTKVVQYYLDEIGFPDVMRRTGILSAFSVGVAFKAVFGFFHGFRPVQHHRLFAVRTEGKTGKHIRFVHMFGCSLFMLPHFLHDIPLLQRNQRLMSVHYQNLLAFWFSDELFVLVRKCGASQSRHVSEIDLVVENASDRAAAPGIRPHRVQPRMRRAGLAVIVICRCQHLFRCEDSGNLVRAFTRSTQFKDSSHHRRGFLIWNDILGIPSFLR